MTGDPSNVDVIQFLTVPCHEFDLDTSFICHNRQVVVMRYMGCRGFAGQRLDIINSTVNIAARLEKLYDFIGQHNPFSPPHFCPQLLNLCTYVGRLLIALEGMQSHLKAIHDESFRCCMYVCLHDR